MQDIQRGINTSDVKDNQAVDYIDNKTAPMCGLR